DQILAFREARSRGADEAIFINRGGNLCEATTANLFVVHDGRAATPPPSAGCLPGITRAHVLKLAGENGINAVERDLSPDELRAAPEACLTSSTRGVQALVELDGEPIGDGVPGPVT